MMELAVPLNCEQIAAANRFHKRLWKWDNTDRALDQLSQKFPGFNADACLLKAVVVNSLYGTQVFAIIRMAEHINEVVPRYDLATAGVELIEAIAKLPPAPQQKNHRCHWSFASKFAHFFIDKERFPIMDSYADKMLKVHLGKSNYVKKDGHPYLAFLNNFNNLRQCAGHQGPGRELDHYLWIAGQYREWKIKKSKGKEAQLNQEMIDHFEKPTPEELAELNIIMPNK